MKERTKYSLRGVSASKSEVHKAIQDLDKGLYPTAFCKILPDAVGQHPEYCNIMHADTAGTKTSLAYLYWRETGDMEVWKGIAQDAIVMNLDDMACVGCFDNIVLSSTIGRNKGKIPGEIISTIINYTVEFCDMLAQHGIHIHLAGGETADVGDIVRTLDVGFTAFARMKRKELIVNDIKNGDVIIGLSSSGCSSYENTYNGGMGSNGLTSARHDVFTHRYKDDYPETFDPDLPEKVIYDGSKQVTDFVNINGENITAGKLVLSPTRTYLPVLKNMIDNYHGGIHGIIHCTGGAQTKVLKFVKGKHIIKDDMFPVPPLFEMLRVESHTDWKEMYQVFNMGHRMELYVEPSIAKDLISISKSFNIDAKVIGRVEDATSNRLTIKTNHGIFEYN